MNNTVFDVMNANFNTIKKEFECITDDKERDKFLRLVQKRNDKAYEENRLTSEILDLQVWINTQRHIHDLPDENEVINRFSDGNFVQ